MKTPGWPRYLLTMIALAMLAACGANHSSDTVVLTSQSVDPQAVQAFGQTIYSFGQKQGCVTCHSVTVNPLWMASDLTTAYTFARPMLNVTSPSSSIFATYAGNNHCNNPICANPANDAVVQGLLTQWAEVEINLSGTGGAVVTSGTPLANPAYVSAPVAVSSALPLLTASNPAIMRFDLSQLTPTVPALNGAILEISIRSYNAAVSEYKIYNPRLAGNSAPVTISGLHIYVRAATGTGLGVEDVNQGDLWSGLQVMVPVSPLPSPLPTGPMNAISALITTSLGIPSQSTSDVLTLGFADIH